MKRILFIAAATVMASCSTTTRLMQEPNTRLNLNKSDFELSPQVAGEATVVRVLWIDWGGYFGGYKEGKVENNKSNTFDMPVIGALIGNTNDYYAYYDMMQANPGYDVVLYPQVERNANCPVLGLCGLYSTTKVKVVARLGKLKQ